MVNGYFYDKQLEFDDSVALSADSTSGAILTGKNVASVDQVSVLTQVLTDTTSAGTLTINVQDSTSGSANWTTIATSGAVTMSSLDVGDLIEIPMPRQNKAYLRVVWDVSADLGTSVVKSLITPSVAVG